MWQAGNSLAASPLANSSRASPERNIAALPPLARSRIPPATQATLIYAPLNHKGAYCVLLRSSKAFFETKSNKHNIFKSSTVNVVPSTLDPRYFPLDPKQKLTPVIATTRCKYFNNRIIVERTIGFGRD